MSEVPRPGIPSLKLGSVAATADDDSRTPRRIPLSAAVRGMVTPRVSSNPDEECVEL